MALTGTAQQIRDLSYIWLYVTIGQIDLVNDTTKTQPQVVAALVAALNTSKVITHITTAPNDTSYFAVQTLVTKIRQSPAVYSTPAVQLVSLGPVTWIPVNGPTHPDIAELDSVFTA